MDSAAYSETGRAGLITRAARSVFSRTLATDHRPLREGFGSW
jgi:hypothetical protein